MNICIKENDGWVDVCAKGRLEALEAEKLYDAVCKCTDKGCRDLRLDLDDIDFISSAGIRALLQSMRKLSASKGMFRITRASFVVQQSLALSGLSSLIMPAKNAQTPSAFPAKPQESQLYISEERSDEKLVLKLSGRLDAYNSEKLFDCVREHAGAGIKELAFDAEGVEYMSSAGIRALVQSHKHMRAAGGSVHISKASRFVLDALAMSGLSSMLGK
ncbi:MAG: anti-sigma factor antagonist [Opitutales bacterium]|nr:anti-sigma factor antagonist [Opitutales bacterium]